MDIKSQDPARVLAQFKLEGIEFSSEDLDDGCFYYAKACQGNLGGLSCTAKLIDRQLLNLHQNAAATENADSEDDLIRRYSSHCELLCSLRHPHLVQFLGLSYKADCPSSAAIVTERLPASLQSVITRYGRLPDELNYSILRDVALALSYLHILDPPVIHGELAACNVLLSWDMRAKLADVGVGAILKLSPEQRRQVGNHTLAHMPPETLAGQGEKIGRYPKVDSYAYGALIVHTLSAKYPEDLAVRASRVYSSKDAASNGIDEILGGVSPDHPLASLALQCLNRAPELRPSSAQISATVNEMMLQFPTPSFERRVEILQRVVKVSHSRKLSGSIEKARAVERKDSIVSLSNTIEIEHLKLQIEELHVENRGLRTSLKKQQSIINARDHEMAAKLMAKDQEILSNQEEIAALESTVSTGKATISAKEATVHGLMNQLRHLQEYLANKHEPHLLSPKAQLKWRQAAHLPQAMVFAQSVCVGETVYYGSGTTTMSEGDGGQRYKIFSYDLSRDKWRPVDRCPVVGFGMSNFMDQLTLVGGAYESSGDGKAPYALTGDVYTYDESSGEYERSIPPMPTARLLPTLMTYGSTLTACGGVVLDEKHDICVSTVEVYSSENMQWYRAEPLPLACTGMSYATIQEHSYLLGGFTDTDFDHPTISVFSISLQRLVEDALTRSRGFGSGGAAAALDSPTPKIWQRFQDAPRYAATATSIGGCLVALGGSDESLEHKSGALHVYSPLTNAWSRMDDIPVMCFSCAVTRLPRSELMIIGGMGHDEEDALKTVFRGRVRLD